MRLTTDPLKTTEATVNIWKISFSSGIRVLCGSLGTIRLAHPILPKIGAIGRFAPIRPDPPQGAWASRPHAARSKVRSRPSQSPFVPNPKYLRAAPISLRVRPKVSSWQPKAGSGTIQNRLRDVRPARRSVREPVGISRNPGGVFRRTPVCPPCLPRSCSRAGWRCPRDPAGPSGRRNRH